MPGLVSDASAISRLYGGESQTRGVEVAVAAIAEAQCGVVARWQLRVIGLGDDGIDSRLAAGRLHRLHPSVFAVGHRALSREARWLAAVLACGRGAVLSHRSAAALWGLRGSVEEIHVTTGRKCRPVQPLYRHYSRLPADEIGAWRGIPVTSVPRTIFDCAGGGDVDLVTGLMRQAEHRRRYDVLSLPHLLERYPRRRGCRTVRLALERFEEEPAGIAASPLEERFLPYLRAYGLPIPRLNEWIDLGGRRYKVDCRWPGSREIVELDGWESHGTRSAFRADRERDRRLRVAGYGLTRISWGQLDDEPAAIAADLRALLRHQATYKRP
jgi:hypothetical protein